LDITLIDTHPSLFDDSGAIINFRLRFGSKTDSVRRRAPPIRLLASPDLSICPVDHIRRLLAHHDQYPGTTSLFRSPTGPVYAASAAQIRQWVSATFKAAHIIATPGSIRSVLATQGFREGDSLQQIQFRGNWRQFSTVQRHYLRT